MFCVQLRVFCVLWMCLSVCVGLLCVCDVRVFECGVLAIACFVCVWCYVCVCCF